jgi:hypothetical protein
VALRAEPRVGVDEALEAPGPDPGGGEQKDAGGRDRV